MNNSALQANNALSLLHSSMLRQVAQLALDGDSAATPRGRGRPAVLDARLRYAVCLLLQFGFPRSLVAAELGISRSAISHAMRRDPEFRRQVLTAEELFARTPVLTLMQACRHDWRAAAWVVKNYAPHASVNMREQRDAYDEWEEESTDLDEQWDDDQVFRAEEAEDPSLLGDEAPRKRKKGK